MSNMHHSNGWKLAEVIGSPIAHSKSPLIHQQWIRALGLDASFNATDVDAASLADWLQLRRLGSTWRGCSVTAPLKQAAMAYVDVVSREARRLGALNLICNDCGRLKGYNTDLEGLRVALAPHVKANGRIVIAGAGGATCAALCYAIDEGFSDIRVVARDPGRVFEKLASRFPAPFHIVPCERAESAINGADVLINATPMGSSYGAPMRPEIFGALSMAAPGAVVLDMVYEPVETDLLKAAKAHGLTPVSGLDMLVGQARRAFQLLFGCIPPSASVMPLTGLDAPFEAQPAV